MLQTNAAKTADLKEKVVNFRFPGDVLSTNAAGLRAELEVTLQSGLAQAGAFEYFDADLSAARMVDSVGLNLLVWLWRQVSARGGRLRLRISSPDIGRTFRFTRFAEHAAVELEPQPTGQDFGKT